MKAAGITEIKQELQSLSNPALLEVCLRLARAKKENKELLTYLLFEAHHLDGYIAQLKELIDEGLAAANTGNWYILKKNLRKLLKTVNKYLRFTASKAVEAEVLLYFCNSIREHNIPYLKSTALANFYHALLKKISAVISTLHEDLQHDLTRQMDALTQ